jgi:putative DNA-invertase from lambdoid prophage Rac
MAVYGYTRVSTASQADDGQSLAVQRRQIAGYVQMQGLYLSKVFVEEGVSGSVPLAERPQGRVLLEKLKAGDTLIVSKLDRAFRSAMDALAMLEHFKRDQIDLVVLDLGGSAINSDIARLLFTILSAVAEWERSRIAGRIREVKRDQKLKGDYLGGPAPFGWKVIDRRYVPDPEQQAAIADIFAMRARGMSYHRIANALRDRGINISHMTVKNVLDGKIKPS